MSGSVRSTKLYRWDSSVYFLFNLLGLVVTVTACTAIFKVILPNELASAGHIQFLTNLSLLFTIFTILSNILTILVPSSLVNYVNIYMNAISIILETLVALIYWSLRIFFIHLIVPKGVTEENFIPVHTDVAVHLFPITFLSLDYYFIKYQNFNIPTINVLLIVTALTSAYWFLLEYLIVPPASYPYPFLNVATQERLVIFAFVALAGFVFYHAFNSLHKPIRSLIYKAEGKAKSA